MTQLSLGNTAVDFDLYAEVNEHPRLRPARRAELLAQLSGAFDLAEGQEPGHAARVAHIALAVARRLDLDAASRRRVLYVALLHDAGVPVRMLPDDVDVTGGHTAAGAWVASLVGLDDQVQRAIRATHERWDGSGRPSGLAMAAIPPEALLVSAAHWACDRIGPDEHPLRARAALLGTPLPELAAAFGQRIAEALLAELRDDTVWMPFWDEQLAASVAADVSGDGRATVSTVERIAGALGQLIDSAVREHGRSERVAHLATELARVGGYDIAERRAIAVAGRLLDLGQLGVPRHITEKPDLLTITEMETMRRHPGWSARLLEHIPALEPLALWVEAHHERPDGRGYPEMLDGTEIPQPARILAVADAYWALRAERPYRSALSPAQALETILGGAGEQFDARVAGWLPAALASMPNARREGSQLPLAVTTVSRRVARGH